MPQTGTFRNLILQEQVSVETRRSGPLVRESNSRNHSPVSKSPCSLAPSSGKKPPRGFTQRDKDAFCVFPKRPSAVLSSQVSSGECWSFIWCCDRGPCSLFRCPNQKEMAGASETQKCCRRETGIKSTAETRRERETFPLRYIQQV